MAVDSPGPEDGPPTPPAEPQVIAGRFEVVRVLGRGSSGRTLLCNDLGDDRRVAIKELRFEQLDAWKHLELFEREASVLARLEHPAIPEVFDFFEGADSATAVYIVQEFVDGPSLRSRIDSGPMLGQAEVLVLAQEMLEVLEYLHGRAPPVLHRDIKPSNILLRENGGVALVDFGGVVLGWRAARAEGATVVGTFGYMPPEQLLGQAGPASDLYALGATLLHALTGRSPTEFSFDSGRIEMPPDLPSGPLVSLIDALLRPAPRDRPQSARAAMDMLTAPAAASSLDPRRGTAIARARAHTPSREVTVVSEHGPEFVDLGPPPRDPKGQFQDVYRNLINPLFPSKRLWSAGMHAFWMVFATIGSVTTVGILPLLYGHTIRVRRRKYADLFRHGHTTRGVIRSAKTGAAYATFKYEFEVEGSGYVAFMEYAVEMAQFWGEGDHVPVLFDPDDPKRSCFVYR